MKNLPMHRPIDPLVKLAVLGFAASTLARCAATDTVATRDKPAGTTGGTMGVGGSGVGGASGATGASGGSGGSGGSGVGANGGVGGAVSGASGSGGSPPVRDASPDITFDWP